MILKDFELGDDVRVACVFKDTTAAAIDPSSVVFKFKNPSGVEITYTFGTNSQLVKDSTGHYRVDIDANALGIWSWKFYSTGAGKGADSGKFKVVSNY